MSPETAECGKDIKLRVAWPVKVINTFDLHFSPPLHLYPFSFLSSLSAAILLISLLCYLQPWFTLSNDAAIYQGAIQMLWNNPETRCLPCSSPTLFGQGLLTRRVLQGLPFTLAFEIRSNLNRPPLPLHSSHRCWPTSIAAPALIHDAITPESD